MKRCATISVFQARFVVSRDVRPEVYYIRDWSTFVALFRFNCTKTNKISADKNLTISKRSRFNSMVLLFPDM